VSSSGGSVQVLPGGGFVAELAAVEAGMEDADPAAGVRLARRSPSVGVMDDKEILSHIDDLIATEHDLRAKVANGELSTAVERERLRSAEEALDQCWDLLRQRRARREFGENPEEAQVRPAAEVEGYQQ
jgi:hypothetical protein